MEVGKLKFTWKIKNFSEIETYDELYSDDFSLGFYKWRIRASILQGGEKDEGDEEDEEDEEQCLSVFLEVANLETLPSGWRRKAKFSVTVIDQINNNFSVTDSLDEEHVFRPYCFAWGFSLIPYKELRDLSKGYLVEDICVIEADVTMYEDVSVESCCVRKETKNEADLAENATEEDIDAFFVDLNSVIFPKKVVSLEEEAKEALEMIDMALNMAPVDLNCPGRRLQLKNAFDVLSSLDDCSILTSEQKAELLSMKDNFIQLPKQAAYAINVIKLFAERELVKEALDQKLGKCLIRFAKAKAETAQNEQNIAELKERVNSLLAQIDETEKKKENSVLKQKEMFKLSKGLKEKLDELVNDWPEYEAKMKEAEEAEKVVGTKWSQMKQFVLSLKLQWTVAKKPVKRTISPHSLCT